MNDVLIQADQVSKKYCRFLRDSMVYGMSDIGRNILGMKSRSECLRKNEFWAVDDVSFEVSRGETLGLIGANGSGKTTILKMLNGIFWPDKGKITVRGRVGALIAVGAGFHPLLTGRENIFVNGAILGMSKQEVQRKFDSIVDFADIGDFLDAPVKHYSSGMYVRLGFAIAVHSRCDILLIDEVLAVGDVNFQAKCMDKIKELGQQGVTKIFISHNFDAVQMLCKNTLYLSKGRTQFYGETRNAISEFKKAAFVGKERDVLAVRHGTREVEINKVEFLDRDQLPRNHFNRGEKFQVRISFSAPQPVLNPHFSVGFNTENGILISKAITHDHGFPTGQIHGDGAIIYTVEALPLTVGKYWITIGCWDSMGQVAYDHHEKAYPLIVEEGAINNKIRERGGYIHIPCEWAICNNYSRAE